MPMHDVVRIEMRLQFRTDANIQIRMKHTDFQRIRTFLHALVAPLLAEIFSSAVRKSKSVSMAYESECIVIFGFSLHLEPEAT